MFPLWYILLEVLKLLNGKIRLRRQYLKSKYIQTKTLKEGYMLIIREKLHHSQHNSNRKIGTKS